ncbi:hypothetical protein HDU67_003237 [Dinochytrium kinnereticum]|nr:hypothetical protein HDU67_003237 [Dinochytrium kinnereticum]
MLQLKDEIIQWNTGCIAFDDGNFTGALEAFEPVAVTSKMHFNMAMAYQNMNMMEQTIECLSKAIACDEYMAVSYFQRGALFYYKGMYAEALADFNDALTFLRGNLLIDYTQLGLEFKLYACEVTYNRGLCFVALKQVEVALVDFDDAMRKRPLDTRADYGRIEKALLYAEKCAKYCNPFEVPLRGVYKPHPEKVRNAEKVDYLGKALVVAAVDRTDKISGFKESKLRTDTLSRKNSKAALDAGEPPTLSRKPSRGTIDKEPFFWRATTLGRSQSTRKPPGISTIFPFASLSRRSRNPACGNNTADEGPTPDSPSTPLSMQAEDSGVDQAFFSMERRRDLDEQKMGAGKVKTPILPRKDSLLGLRSAGVAPDVAMAAVLKAEAVAVKSLKEESVVTEKPVVDKEERKITQIRLKCHYTDTRILKVPADITFAELSKKVQNKFSVPYPLKLKYRDSGKDFISIVDQEDLDAAFRMAHIGSSENGSVLRRFELWCFLR